MGSKQRTRREAKFFSPNQIELNSKKDRQTKPEETGTQNKVVNTVKTVTAKMSEGNGVNSGIPNADSENVLDDLMQNNVQFDEDEKPKTETITNEDDQHSDISENEENSDSDGSDSDMEEERNKVDKNDSKSSEKSQKSELKEN